MRVSSRLGYGDGFRKTAERAMELERAGVDVLWVAEAYGFDAATQLGYLAAKTERALLASGIFNIYSRTPALLAQTAAGLDELSGGRAILGLGASGPQVIEGWHGVAYDRPVQRTREIMHICRAVWRREEVRHQGKAYTLPLPGGLGKPIKILTHPVRERIPIYLASLGQQSVELAAEMAEGWLPIFYLPERAGEIWGEALRRGQHTRADELGRLEIVAGGPLAIGEGLEHLRDHERAHLALYVGGMGARGKNFYNDLIAAYGFAAEARQIQDAYLSGDRHAAMAAVPARLLEGLTLIGPESHVRQRIEAFRASGVTMLDVQPVGPDPVGDVERVKTWVSA